MKRLELLSQLINTLSKAEKRYFKLMSNLQKGKKEYLYLYDKLEAGNSTDDVYKSFCRKYGKKGFETSVKYLYDQLLDSLTRSDRKTDIQDEIFRLISRSSSLYERRFVKEALQKLSKAKQLARDFEQDILLLLIRRTEIVYIMENDFMNYSERELVGMQTKLNECLKYTRSTNMHVSLFSTLNYRLYNLEQVRSDKQKEAMNDLVLSELNLISNNNNYQRFESMKMHLLFQASYYLHTGSYKSAIRYYAELLDLFDEYEHLKRNPPIYYLSTIEGIINSLLTAGLYYEIPLFIEKLEHLKGGNYPEDFLLKVRFLLFFSQTEYLIRTGRFREALQLSVEYEDILLKKTKSLNPENRLRLNLSCAIIFLCNNEPKKARRKMRLIMQEGKLFQIYPLYRTSRLLSLIIDVELHDYELLENEIRSIKRAIRSESQSYMTENLVFKFILQCPIPKYEKARLRIWEKARKEIDLIHANKYERQILKIFDFPAWIESKLTLKPFSEVLLSLK